MHPVASLRLWAGQSVVNFGGLIKSADYAPRLELLHHLVPIMARPHQVPPAAKMIRHLPMRGQKSLRMLHRLEPPHSAFPFPSRLMGVFGSIIESSAAAVVDLWNELTMCGGVARQFVGDQRSGTVLQPLEEFLEEALCRPGVAFTLYHNIQHFAFLVHRSPQVDQLSVDLAEHFIEKPGIPTPAPPLTKAPSVRGTEFQTPQANGLMGDDDTVLQHHFLDIAETQAQAEIQPDAMRNNLGWEAVSPAAWCSGGVHLRTTSRGW